MLALLVGLPLVGYGFSDVVDTDRSVDTVMEQSRKALVQAGVTGPYVLCPHSLWTSAGGSQLSTQFPDARTRSRRRSP